MGPSMTNNIIVFIYIRSLWDAPYLSAYKRCSSRRTHHAIKTIYFAFCVVLTRGAQCCLSFIRFSFQHEMKVAKYYVGFFGQLHCIDLRKRFRLLCRVEQLLACILRLFYCNNWGRIWFLKQLLHIFGMFSSYYESNTTCLFDFFLSFPFHPFRFTLLKPTMSNLMCFNFCSSSTKFSFDDNVLTLYVAICMIIKH